MPNLGRALRDAEPSWVTLPRQLDGAVPMLLEAIETFDAGSRPAARAAATWLRTEALGSYETARTRLLVAEGRILGFYSLASAQVALSQRDRKRLGVERVTAPAALVAWVAKAADAEIDGSLLLKHAAATARRAAALQATAVLVIDPFDEETRRMWQEHFGFRKGAKVPGQRARLWLPLAD